MKKVNQKPKSIVLFVLMLVVAVVLSYLAYFGVGENNLFGIENIKLGLDLQGGVNIVYEAAIEKPTAEDMAAAVQMIRTRLDKEGYTEADATKEGSNRIRVDIPGVEDAQAAIDSIGAAAMLRFFDEAGNEILTGKNIERATPVINTNNLGRQEPAVSITMDAEGTKIFSEFTKNNIGKAIFIKLDEQVISQARISSHIPNGEGMISGSFTTEEAKQLAERIEAGSLPFALKAVSSDGIGAKLGMGALDTSIQAGVIGFIFILIFMVILYRFSGIAADIALVIYVALLLIILSLTGATLTLPGIAGIILSIGMAVDANVIIFTRIKEELTAGRSVRSAIETGFNKAFSAILDGNVTTLIAAAVLYTLGTGVIKSFATTLAIGIVVSMFTAIVITRVLLKLLVAMGIDKPVLYGGTKHTQEKESVKTKILRVVEKRKVFFILSSVLILIGLLAMPFNAIRGNGMLNYDIEFKGGSVMTVDLGVDVDPQADIMPMINEIIPEVTPRFQKITGTNQLIITMQTTTAEQRTALYDALVEKYSLTGEKQDQLLKDSNISPSISPEFKVRAIQAVLLGAVLMLIYISIRFKDFKLGASAVIALLHNVLIMLGVYAVFRIPLNNSFIAAMLTIIGYSINDTIIIFDRIRENKGKMKGEEDEVINASVGQTLTRSINTSLTTLVMVVLLYILGVASVKEFAFPLVVGIVAGTYSSIFIASPLWYEMRKFQRNRNKNKAPKGQKASAK